MLVTTADGAVCALSPAHRRELGERTTQALHLLHVQPCAPEPRAIGRGQGCAGAGIEKSATDRGHLLIRPPRSEEPREPVKVFPGWLRQRICALNAAIRHNWPVGAPAERPLLAYDH